MERSAYGGILIRSGSFEVVGQRASTSAESYRQSHMHCGCMELPRKALLLIDSIRLILLGIPENANSASVPINNSHLAS